MKNNNILTVSSLTKHFVIPQGTVKAVNGINFYVKKGETLGIVGESGSGKSTVAYILAGIYRPTQGDIIYKGKYSLAQGFKKRSLELKRDIQIVFQDPSSSLNPSFAVWNILENPLKFHKIGKNSSDREGKILEWLKTVELSEDYIYKNPAEMGGGEKQMVSIARSLLLDPSLVILDEPTSALDVSVQAKVIHKLLELQSKLNLTYIFITHDLSLMRNVASRIIIMYLGTILETASSSIFFQNPLHPYTRMLISSVMVITDEEENLKPKDVTSIGEIPSPLNIPIGCPFYERCPKRMEICKLQKPAFVEVEDEHFVRCHLFHKSANSNYKEDDNDESI